MGDGVSDEDHGENTTMLELAMFAVVAGPKVRRITGHHFARFQISIKFPS